LSAFSPKGWDLSAFSPKGWDVTAQGNALGNGTAVPLPSLSVQPEGLGHNSPGQRPGFQGRPPFHSSSLKGWDVTAQGNALGFKAAISHLFYPSSLKGWDMNAAGKAQGPNAR
jgi:hypothetical protein